MKIALTVSPDLRLITLDEKTITFTIVQVTANHATATTTSVVHASHEEAKEEFQNDFVAYNMVDINADKDDEVMVVKKIVRQAVMSCAARQTESLAKQLTVLPF